MALVTISVQLRKSAREQWRSAGDQALAGGKGLRLPNEALVGAQGGANLFYNRTRRRRARFEFYSCCPRFSRTITAASLKGEVHLALHTALHKPKAYTLDCYG